MNQDQLVIRETLTRASLHDGFFFSQVNDITFHIIMGSKSVTLGEVRKAVKTCLLILPNDQSYFSLKTLLKYEQRFLFLKKF